MFKLYVQFNIVKKGALEHLKGT